MPTLPLTRPGVPDAPARTGFLAEIAWFFRVLAAATRAARSVEARRQPHPEDLKTLGIEGRLPQRW